jgi:RsiW-degrading membrane proteinase PrsW (M82 family)
MHADVTLALSVAVTLAACCVGALRVVDVNEKEPLWSLGLLIWLGVAAAAGAALAFDPQRAAFEAALLGEGAKAVAIALGVAVIVLVGRRRGVSDLNSVLDCLLYGAAAGFGFAIGDGFLRATYSSVTELQSPDPRNAVELLWMTVQSFLTEAAFGAILGAAIGGAVLMRGRLARLVVVPAGLALAVGVHTAYAALVLEDGVHAPDVSAAGVVTILLILALVAAGLFNALSSELRIIAEELEDEQATGVVTAAELGLLAQPVRRQRAYVKSLAAGELGRWLSERRLHNLQVRLAFAKRRATTTSGAEAARLHREVDLIRQSIANARDAATVVAVPGRGRFRAAVALGAAVALLAGGAAVVAAAGEQAPSSFATRTSLAERETRRLEERGEFRRPLQETVSLVPAEWRLREGHEDGALLGAGAAEAYALEYVAPDYGTIHYTIARLASARAAKDEAKRLGRARDAYAWAADEVVSQVRGPEDARWEFCYDAVPEQSPEDCTE